MQVIIPDDVLSAAKMTEGEVMRELAITLFQQERLTLGQARRLARMSRLDFQAMLAERRIPIHYGIDEFHEDIKTLRDLGRL
jgi:predicted HTH domain antitoxin